MAAAAPAAAPAPVAVRRKSAVGSRFRAEIDMLKGQKAAALKRTRELTSSRPARVGFAALGGAVGGMVDLYTSIDVAGRSIPWALPVGLAGAIFGGKSPEIESASLGMIGFGLGAGLKAEAARMGYGRAG